MPSRESWHSCSEPLQSTVYFPVFQTLRLDTRLGVWVVSVLYLVSIGLDMPASVYLFCVDVPMLYPASDSFLSLSTFMVDEIWGCQLSGQPFNNPSGFDAHVNDALDCCD